GGACPQHTAERVLAKLGDQRRGKRADLQLAVGADEANLKLAAVATLAHHEVAQERSPVGGRTGALLTRAAHILATVRVGRLLLLLGPGAPAAWPTSATPRMQSLLATPTQRRFPCAVAALGGQQAIVDRLNHVPARRGVETAHQPAVRSLAKRVLQLVAVTPLLERRHDLLKLEAIQLADPPQRVIDLLVLDLQLALVEQHLPRHPGMRRGRRYPLRAWPQDLHDASMRVAALALDHLRAHAIPGNGARDEHDVATVAKPPTALAAVRERLDLQLDLLAALGTLGQRLRRARGRCACVQAVGRELGTRGGDAHEPTGPTSSSSSAFCACRR